MLPRSPLGVPCLAPAARRVGWRGRPLGRVFLAVVVLLALAAGCTRSAVPFPRAVLPSTLTAVALIPRAPRPPYSGLLASEYPFGVLGVPDGDVLIVRPVAGVEGSASGTLAFDQRGLHVTGQQTALGSSIWVEVERPDGGTGWGNAQNLTEEVGAAPFCADARVLQLLDSVGQAVANRDGALLASLASPRRGLEISLDWRGPRVPIPTGQVGGIFQSSNTIDWGINSSGVALHGSFSSVVLPFLDRALGPHSILTCDEIGAGSILREVRWPSEYTNLNFYSFYRPSEEGGSEYSWTTWLAGVEYAAGQPYLAALVLLRAGI